MSRFIDRLHPRQLEIAQSPKRFKVVEAGRRFGKTDLACSIALEYACMEKNAYGYPLQGTDIYYVCPTSGVGMETAWGYLLEIGGEDVTKTNAAKQWVEIREDCRVFIKSAERPDLIRGRAGRLIIVDEMSLMKPWIWTQVLRPMLIDVKGNAFFIGTSKPGQILIKYLKKLTKNRESWGYWNCNSRENPHIDAGEIEEAASDMGKSAAAQELDADDKAGGGKIFKPAWAKVRESFGGPIVITCKLGTHAGMESNISAEKASPSAIVTASQAPDGVHIHNIQTGSWSVQHTVDRLLKLYQEKRAMCIGMRAQELEYVEPYLREASKRSYIYPRLEPVSDNIIDQVDRITWALQGRFRDKTIGFDKGRYLAALKEQMYSFPLQLAGREMLNALSYLDQLPRFNHGPAVRDHWAPLDPVAGY